MLMPAGLWRKKPWSCIEWQYPALRGRGTGSELLQQAETLALSLGLRYLKTDTYALNEKAQQLFLKHGYHFCGEIQFRKMEHQFYCYEKVL